MAEYRTGSEAWLQFRVADLRLEIDRLNARIAFLLPLAWEAMPVDYAKLKSLRKDRGFKLDYVAASVGTSLNYLSDIERGYRSGKRLIGALAEFYGVPKESLLDESPGDSYIHKSQGDLPNGKGKGRSPRSNRCALQRPRPDAESDPGNGREARVAADVGGRAPDQGRDLARRRPQTSRKKEEG